MLGNIFAVSILFFVAVSSEVNLGGNVTCTENETYTDCLNPCMPSCQIPFERECNFLVCNEGCLCNDGFKKDLKKTMFGGECVAESECQSICLPFQEYKECGPLCPPTCENPEPVCEEGCLAGCFCEDGWIFSELFTLCVKSCPQF